MQKGAAAAAGCPGGSGAGAPATGGAGGANRKRLFVRGSVNGLENVTIGTLSGGAGGEATATGCDRGSGSACCDGGVGGDATATGGTGGEASLNVSGLPVTEMRDGIYIAELVFGDERVVSARPSDAAALAVRTGAPIFGADDLLDEVGIEIPDEQEDEVEKFREFLDQISPEDFGAGSGSGGAP